MSSIVFSLGWYPRHSAVIWSLYDTDLPQIHKHSKVGDTGDSSSVATLQLACSA